MTAPLPQGEMWDRGRAAGGRVQHPLGALPAGPRLVSVYMQLHIEPAR